MDVFGMISTMTVAHFAPSASLVTAGFHMTLVFGFAILADSFFFLYMKDEDFPAHAPQGEEACAYPLPTYLKDVCYEKTVNLAVVGVQGAGKSALINALRGVPATDVSAAPEGCEGAQTAPVAYHLPFPGPTGETNANLKVRIWELPSVGSSELLLEDCIQTLGLRYFDGVIFAHSQRLTALEEKVALDLQSFRVPFFLVRTQADVDVENEMWDHGVDRSEAIKTGGDDLKASGFAQTFLVSSRETESYDLQALLVSVVTSAEVVRRTRLNEECPICYEQFRPEREACFCHWCGNAVCEECSRQMQSDFTPCPFCRRWTLNED
jgi:GTPase SAR1 family protein